MSENNKTLDEKAAEIVAASLSFRNMAFVEEAKGIESGALLPASNLVMVNMDPDYGPNPLLLDK